MRRLPPDRHVECLAEDWVDLVPQRELHHLHPYDDATPAPSGRRFTNVVASPPALPSPPASSPDAWLALAEESMRPPRADARGHARAARAARARVRDRAQASRRRAGSEDDDGGERRNPRGRERTRSARARVGATAGLRDAFLLVRGFRERVSRTETSRQRVPWHSSARALRRGGDGGGRFVFRVTTRIRRVTFFGGRSATRTRRRSVSRTRRASFFSRLRRLARVRRRDRVAALGAGADARERRRASAKRHRGGRGG